jgi:hypothetical protein
MADAKQIREAMLQADHQRLADLTHPSLVNVFGGRDKYVKRVSEIAAEMNAKGFGFADVVLNHPSELVEERGRVYAIVPFDLHMTGPRGATGVKPSYLISVSSDGGANWKFLDGEGVADDRPKLRSLLPNFPDRLALPSKKETQWTR